MYELDVAPLAQPLINGRWASRLSVGIVDGNRERVQVLGPQVREPSKQLYEIGSLSKVFTATVLATLVDDELIGLRDPIARCISGAPNVTFYGLATHTSGLPALPPNLAALELRDPYAGYDESLLLTALESLPALDASAGRFGYSNFGFGVLGHALARCAGQSFDNLVEERVLSPLGMHSTTFREDLHGTQLAQGHDADGISMGPWTFGVLAGAGAGRSTIVDMTRFLRANAEPESSAVGSALRATHSLARPDPEGPRIGLAWLATDDGWLWHNGQTGGHHSFMAFSPETKRGVVILADTATDIVDRLGMAIMRVLHGRDAAFSVPKTITLTEDELDRFVGRYAFAPGVEMTIERRNGAVYGTIGGQVPITLYPSSATALHARAVDAKVEFALDEAGRTSGLRLHQGGAVTSAIKAVEP